MREKSPELFTQEIASQGHECASLFCFVPEVQRHAHDRRKQLVLANVVTGGDDVEKIDASLRCISLSRVAKLPLGTVMLLFHSVVDVSGHLWFG